MLFNICSFNFLRTLFLPPPISSFSFSPLFTFHLPALGPLILPSLLFIFSCNPLVGLLYPNGDDAHWTELYFKNQWEEDPVAQYLGRATSLPLSYSHMCVEGRYVCKISQNKNQSVETRCGK